MCFRFSKRYQWECHGRNVTDGDTIKVLDGDLVLQHHDPIATITRGQMKNLLVTFSRVASICTATNQPPPIPCTTGVRANNSKRAANHVLACDASGQASIDYAREHRINPVRSEIPPQPYLLPFKENIQDLSCDGKNIYLETLYE